MEENKRRYDELSEYMKKIQESMQISNQRKEELDKLQQELNEETRIMMVDKEKEQIESKKLEKAEFDEMTVNAMVNAKKDILELKQDIEKEYIDKLLQMQSEEKEIESKFNRMQQRGLDKEKMDWAIQSRDKAITDLQNEKQKYQAEHENQMKNLQDWEMDIEKYAIELDVLDKIDNVRITAPASTPTTPVSTPTTPVSTPTAPVSTPTAPASTPTTPVSTPTAPASTPTRPGSKDSLKNLKEIKIGKDGVVLFNRDATYYLGETTAFDFKDMKDAYKGYGKGEYEKEEIINDLITENSLSQEIIDNMDPVILEAIKYQKDHKMILKEEAEAFVSMYTSALNGDKDSQKMLKDIITYDRRGMDYLKPSNIFDRIRNRKAFKEFRKFAGSHENFSKIIPDEPGKIRGLLSNIPGIKRLFKKKENPQLLNPQQTQTTPDPTQTKPKEATIDYETAEKLMNTARAFKNMSSRDLAKTSGLDYRKDVPHVDVPKKNIREEVKVDAQTAKNIKAVEESFKNMSSRDLLKTSGLDYRKDVPHVDVPKKNEGIDK